MRLNPNIDLQNEVPGHNLVFLFKDLTFQDSAIDGFHRLFVSIFGYPFPTLSSWAQELVRKLPREPNKRQVSARIEEAGTDVGTTQKVWCLSSW